MYEQEIINLFHKGQLSEQKVEGIKTSIHEQSKSTTVLDSQQPVVGQQFGLKTINAINAVENRICQISLVIVVIIKDIL